MIDRETVERIKSAANIVEVVQEFVTLRRSGANYKGLCPFHDEKTPSFIVSPARGTCHCFGCGKGGNPVSFIMEHEQMSYVEALKWLARKYHIEVKERELTSEEKAEESRRESMFIVNEWAAGHFADILHTHPDGQAVGMAYFRSRGFRDDIIKKFRLGFSLPDRKALAATAIAAGYKEEFLLSTGLCYKTDHGELIDRYAGRVIFPWIGVSGKVTGFGGRLLDQRTKGVSQKYVNSPDSDIYHKDHELYGIFQAKKAIAKADRVFMVEGYTDVISMHQCGIENVVANSGTALSVHQIHILRRFTTNVTLLYDGDAAGIHAALRGTDMMLSEGMNMKVLLLPDGDDPDSFARKHTAADFRQYIDEHQMDFIQFKTDLMLAGEADPLKRSQAIGSIVASIAVIGNGVLRDTYIHDCSVRTGVSELTLINEMNKIIRQRKENGSTAVVPAANVPTQQAQNSAQAQNARTNAATKQPGQATRKEEIERDLIALVVRHGADIVCDNVETDDGQTVSLTLTEYLYINLADDSLSLSTPIHRQILEEAYQHCHDTGFSPQQYFVNHDDIGISSLASSFSIDVGDIDRESLNATSDEPDAGEMEKARQQLRLTLEHLLVDFRIQILEQRKLELTRSIVQAGANQMATLAQLRDVQANLQRLSAMIGRSV